MTCDLEMLQYIEMYRECYLVLKLVMFQVREVHDRMTKKIVGLNCRINELTMQNINDGVRYSVLSPWVWTTISEVDTATWPFLEFDMGHGT